MRRVIAGLTLALGIAMSVGGAFGPAGAKAPQPPDRRSGVYDVASFQLKVPSDASAPGFGSMGDVVCTGAVAAQPSEFIGNVLLNCDTVGPHTETAIAVNPTNRQNVLAASHAYIFEQRGRRVVFRLLAAVYASPDGGATWTEVHPPRGEFQFIGDPVVTFDGDGNAYFISLGAHEGTNALSDPSILVQRSSDGGLRWTDPVTVARGAGATSRGGQSVSVSHDKPWGTVDTSPASPRLNTVYVTWSQFRFGVDGYLESPIYFSRSTDGGASWSEPRDIGGQSVDLCKVQIESSSGPNRCDENQWSQPVVAPDGTLYVSFLNVQNETRPAREFRSQVLVVKSVDGGLTWSNPVAATGLIHDGESDYPVTPNGRQALTGCAFRVNASGSLAFSPVDSNRLFYAYVENQTPGPNTQTDVMVVTSANGGTSWSAPVVVQSSGADQIFPWAAVGQDGKLRIGYMDRDRTAPPGQTCVYGYTLSTATDSAGVVFTNQPVETGLSIASNGLWLGTNAVFVGDYTNLAIGPDGTLWAAWADMRQDATFFGLTGKDLDAVAHKVP